MLRTDKYGDDLLEPTAADLRTAPSTPQIDRLPAHVRTAIQCGEHDAEIVCVPECPACEVEWSLSRFWDEVGGYPDEPLWLA